MQCDVDPKARIGKNIKFGHGGRGIVIGNATIGNNVTIMHNVTIANNFLAKNEKEKKFPEIGNNVTIGTGAIIMGGIKIGDNSTIGAGSFINKDIPSNSVAYNERKTMIRKKFRSSLPRLKN